MIYCVALLRSLLPAVNECRKDPCENGGTCIDGIGRYTCQCEQGFTGPQCQQGQKQRILTLLYFHLKYYFYFITFFQFNLWSFCLKLHRLISGTSHGIILRFIWTHLNQNTLRFYPLPASHVGRWTIPRITPITVNLHNWNFHPLEVVLLKWVEIIQIWQHRGQRFWYLADLCHVFSSTW